MTAREFLNWAIDGDFDLEEALFALGHYTGKGGSKGRRCPENKRRSIK